MIKMLVLFVGLLTCLAVFARFSRLWNYVRGIPIAHKCLLSTFFVTLIFGHVFKRDRLTFPLIPWWMYGMAYDSSNEIIYYRYVGIEKDGDELALTPSEHFPVLGRGTYRMANHLRTLAENAEAGQPDKLAAMLNAIGAEHNRHKEEPIERIRAEFHSFPYSDEVPENPPEQVRTVLEVEL